MDLREELESVERIEEWMREGGFSISEAAMSRMVDLFVYDEDIERAMKEPRYCGIEKRPGGPVFCFTGPDLQGGRIAVGLRLTRKRVIVAAVERLPDPPPERN